MTSWSGGRSRGYTVIHRAIFRAQGPADLAIQLAGVRRSAPPEVFARFAAAGRGALGAAGWAELERRLEEAA